MAGKYFKLRAILDDKEIKVKLNYKTTHRFSFNGKQNNNKYEYKENTFGDICILRKFLHVLKIHSVSISWASHYLRITIYICINIFRLGETFSNAHRNRQQR